MLVVQVCCGCMGGKLQEQQLRMLACYLMSMLFTFDHGSVALTSAHALKTS